MNKLLIKNATIINEGKLFESDLLIVGERIEKIAKSIQVEGSLTEVIDAAGLYLMPGMIDDQVHFREPGLTHKATLRTESMAAVAGGITSFMDMPNTIPNTISLNLLEQKYQIAQQSSLANFSFFMGLTKNNFDEALKINNELVCGLSDDGLYFDDEEGILANYPDQLDKLFSRTNSLIALHCEDTDSITKNLQFYSSLFNEDIPVRCHPLIRTENSCYMATERVLEIAKKHATRLHILHLSTAKETQLFSSDIPLRQKRITAEACVHHLWFSDSDYSSLGNLIKWNPAIKTQADKEGLLAALKNNSIDIIATDHAPHILAEKSGKYSEAKPGGPLVQHAMVTLLELVHQEKISLEQLIEKTSHNVATIYRIKERGFIRESYYADLVLVDINKTWQCRKENILSKCAWSPFENQVFKSKIVKTLVNGTVVYNEGSFNESVKGKRLTFERDR